MTFDLAFHLTDLRVILAGTLVTLLLAGEIGWRIGDRGVQKNEALRTLIGGVAAATIGFLGLLLGFTLSVAMTRYDARRAVIVDEANAIGTLWLRAGMLHQPLDAELRGVLREYTQARLDLGRMDADLEKLREARVRSARLQQAMWSLVERAAGSEPSPAVVSVLVSAANEVIDLDELRMSSLENYVPALIMLVLIGVAAVALAFLGWSFAAAQQRSVVSMVMLSVLVTVVLGVIHDINRPQRGLFRVSDNSLVRLQQSIANPTTP